MNSFRYQAVDAGGKATSGSIQAEDRKSALQLLGHRGVFPSLLEVMGAETKPLAKTAAPVATSGKEIQTAKARQYSFSFGSGVSRKHVTAFTREMAALIAAAIPIPQALDSLADEEENQALQIVLKQVAEGLRKGASFSASLDEHPKLFSKLYVSMIRVGEEAGELPKVLADLSSLLEHEDEIRSEVRAAVAYPLFVLVFGVLTVAVLLTVVLPRLFSMLQEMLDVLPLPTLILLNISSGLHKYWLLILIVIAGISFAIRWYLKTEEGALNWDKIKLKLPVMGAVFRSAALGRFARTLGTLEKSGVSLLPALKIVENTIGNRILAAQVAQVAEETRGGDSLAGPLRKLGLFPKTVVKMIDVGEQSGQLDEMLLKVADIEERHMRAKIKTLISLIAPVLIMVVGAMVGFMVIAILLPIFKMSRAIH